MSAIGEVIGMMSQADMDRIDIALSLLLGLDRV